MLTKSQPAIRSSRIDYSMAGEALIVARLLPTTGPHFLVDVNPGDGITWSLSRGLLDEGWSGLLLESNALLDRGLSSVLTENGVPRQFQLLILNAAEFAAALLAGLDPQAHRPGIIVTKDLETGVSRNSHSYSFLTRSGYSFAGTAGSYSIWTVVPLPRRSYAPQTLHSLPSLADTAPAIAYFDPTPTALACCGAAGEQTYLISGWAFAESDYTIPPLVYLEVQDHRTGSLDYYEAYRCQRPDVSAHFGRADLAWCGFRALISIDGHMSGSLSVRVIQRDAERSYLSPFEITVKRPLEDYESDPRLGLARKFLQGTGIEIGALQRPLPLPPFCRVRYVDRMALSDLLHHYPELQGLPLQAPDLIDDGEQLAMIADNSQDFLIANHFFEHTQNPLHSLSTFLRVLRVGGVLFMAVPDKRFTFDFDRPCTQYSIIHETYRSGIRRDREALFREWVALVERVASQDVNQRAAQLMADDYSIHFNVWTVDDLLTQLLQARSDFALPFRLLTAVCSDNEAILLLQKIDADLNAASPALTSSYPSMSEPVTAISNVSSSDSTQTNVRYSVWKYAIPLPPDALIWSVGGATIENFLVVGDAWAQVVSKYTQDNTTLLDIGCGCGRTARILVNNRWITKYIGFDVIRQNIDWCARYITPAWHGVAEFHWFDVYSREYNPTGPIKGQDVHFPCRDGEADVIFAASLFTHLLEPDAIHYLNETGRCLSARGRAILSIHNAVPPGERFYGTETRIDMDPSYFSELAAAAGMREIERIDDLAGQQVFVFGKLLGA